MENTHELTEEFLCALNIQKHITRQYIQRDSNENYQRINAIKKTVNELIIQQKSTSKVITIA